VNAAVKLCRLRKSAANRRKRHEISVQLDLHDVRYSTRASLAVFNQRLIAAEGDDVGLASEHRLRKSPFERKVVLIFAVNFPTLRAQFVGATTNEPSMLGDPVRQVKGGRHLVLVRKLIVRSHPLRIPAQLLAEFAWA